MTGLLAQGVGEEDHRQTYCAMCGSGQLTIMGVFVDYEAGACRWKVACGNGHEMAPYPGTVITVQLGPDQEPLRMPWMNESDAPENVTS